MASLIGVFAALLMVLAGAHVKHVSIAFLFTNVPALLIVLGGAFFATMASFDMATTKRMPGTMKKALINPPSPDLLAMVRQLVAFASKARKEGLLALEPELANVEHPFMKKGLQLAVDGNDPEAVYEVLRTDIKSMKARHKIGESWCTTFGTYAPSFGIIGAVMGLIATLGSLDDSEKLGAGIAAAFVATFWGVFLANGMFLPMASRLKRLTEDEAQSLELMLEGIMAIQAGQNPRVVEDNLMSFLPPSQAADAAGELERADV